MTTFIRTQPIKDGAALHKLCDDLCCTSFCQTAWQLNSPATDSGVLVALLLMFKTEEALNPGSVFVLDFSCQ